MEATTSGRPAAAADFVGDGRRFPDSPPPPHGRETDSASADMAALVFRREQLLQELHRERIRHDMIMCELAETERVMTACLAGRGALCGRSLMTPWEEAMYRSIRSSEETCWWRGRPSGPAKAPVYPRVERSPSPVLQPRPVHNAENQERGSSSRPMAGAPSAHPDVEQCLSLRKQPTAEEALVPSAANVVSKPAQPALLSKKEATLESRGVVDHEHEAGSKDRHALDQEHKGEAKDTHAVQLMDCEIQRSEHSMHVAVGQEYRAEAKDRHAMKLMGCEIKRSEHLKYAASCQEREVDTNIRHTVQVMESKFWRSEQVKQGAVVQEHQAEVENKDEVKLTVSEIQRSEKLKREAFGQEHKSEDKDRHVLQLSKISEQTKPTENTIKDHTDEEQRQLCHQHALPGKEKSPPNELKRLVFNEPSTQITPSGVKGNQILGPIVETPPPKRHKPLEDWSCTYCKVSLSCEEDLTRHQTGDLHQLVLALHARQEAAGLTTKSTPESSDRANLVVRPIRTNNLGKSEPQKAKCVAGFYMRNHSKHMSHQANTQTVHRKESQNHFSDRSHQESRHALHTGGHGKEGNKCAADRMGTDDRRTFMAKRRLLFCDLCNVQCNSEKMMESHLGGKRHRENLQARH